MARKKIADTNIKTADININTRIKMNHGGQIPQLGLGVWQIPDGKPTEDAVLHALKAGYRHIDTAKIYGNERGVGSAIRKSGIPREEIFVTTKLWNTDHADPEYAFRKSLERLDIDYIDLYLIHWPVEIVRNDSWKMLERLVKNDECKAIGVSNYTIPHLQSLLKSAKVIPAVNQVEFHPYLYQKELLEFCKSKGIILEAYSPLTRGKRLDDPGLVALAEKYSKTPAQILIRWCIQKGVVVIPKSANPQRIKENADVFDFEIDPADMELLDDFGESYRTTWDPTNAP